MAKKAINWTEIKERFLLGEAPRIIAPDYKDLTPEKISRKANKDAWRGEKERKREIISQAVNDRVIENVFLTRERLQQELISLAYSDYRDYAHKHRDGNITYTAFDDMPEGATRAIKKIKYKQKKTVLENEDGEEEGMLVETQTEYELHPKMDAIKTLLTMLGFEKPAEAKKRPDRIKVEFTLPKLTQDKE